MGSEASRQKQKDVWQLVSKTSECSIFRNARTQDEFQEYTRLLSSQEEYLEELKSYECRVQQNLSNIVKVQKIQCRQQKQLCSVCFRLQLYIEHLPLTLDRLEHLTLPYSLYLLLEILTASRYLRSIYPDFIIDETRVFMNRKGQVKVWISDNPVDNRPTASKLLISSQIKSEYDIVQIIFDMVESRTIADEFPLDLVKPFRLCKMSLDEAISHIKIYCFDRRIQIPQNLMQYLMQEQLTSNNTTLSLTKNSCQIDLQKENRKKNLSVLSYIASECREKGKSWKSKWESDPCRDLGCEMLRKQF